ncbi:MAG: N-acetylmuramoyl-L-alanine amidase, partial [Psychrobacter sp.]|nr:N-acetylmuramoyl-L-alanine amidase [Psychrobacter sp.]
VSFTAVRYEVLARVISAIYQAYPKTRRHLTGHSDIAPGRKTDPGDYFEWPKLRDLIAKNSDQ